MIDYKILFESLDYYIQNGYQRIEVPWTVTEAVDSITRPDGVEPYTISNKNKNLIASGEQGFLYLYLKGYLSSGKYITMTPCFRNDSYDLTHSKTFMKSELIIVEPDMKCIDVLIDDMIGEAIQFFSKYFKKSDLKIVKIDDSFDIEVEINGNSYELGSYGFRKYKHMRWIYGTACAEPRLSRLLKIY